MLGADLEKKIVKSRASRSCGLKFFLIARCDGDPIVTSFTLVWIKIVTCVRPALLFIVTSFTLVWIKMA